MTSHEIDPTGCFGSTIKVAAGHYLDLEAPSVPDVDITSIAAALSKICRFGGHCPKFYSVAEHCVLASRLTATHPLEVLLHDAAEAYVGDMVKPLKNLIGESFINVERRIDQAIVDRFGLRDDAVTHGEIKRCDYLMLKAEKTAFWPLDAEQWVGFKDLPLVDVGFGFLSPIQAESEFLVAAHQLGIG